jgi:2,4-dienoyl-CoA reductase-like NADH-dependent reductase (Old Yellow Enzyme family)/NADPH-dependent 2,4-dienoyl-CoA reductase/sulfur reductase-like enzyme
MSSGKYSHLLSPGRIGTLELPNRLVVMAMGMSLGEEDGTVSERLLRYHEEQAKGGVGLIVSGACGIAWPVAAVQKNQMAISDDRFIPGLARLIDAVHAHGSKFAVQLHFGGMMAGYSLAYGHPLWVPSMPGFDPADEQIFDAYVESELVEAAKAPKVKYEFKVVTKEDLQLVVRQYAEAAVRARQAGADAVEIHAGHGYLLSSFINPRFNRRTDEYGGPLENRMRFLLEVVRAVRAAVGPDFAVIVKIDSQQYGAEDGIQLPFAVETAKMVEQAGADAIAVSSFHHLGKLKMHSESNIPHVPDWNLPAAEAIKRAVSIPVITSGRVEPETGDARIAAGAFDFLGMGRKLLADPHLPRKLAEGKPESIRPCIYCYTCVSCIYLRDSARCAVNPDTAFEYLGRTGRKAAAPKHYVVVGGGPGGMEAALRLDAQGHRVTLLERTERLGGTLRIAALPYEPNENLLDWMIGRIEASNVEVRLDTPATAEIVSSLAPAAVLVATGAKRTMPPIPGSNLPHVLSGDDMRKMMLGQSDPEMARKLPLMSRMAAKAGAALGLTASPSFVRKATRQWMPLGKRIVVIGGELVGIELAEFLVERGRSVTVLEEASRMGYGLQLVRRMRVLTELREHGVGLFPGARDIRIEEGLVRYTDAAGQEASAEADHVIVAKGAGANTAVADELQAAGLNVHAFGDCTGVAYIEGALRGAADLVDELTR